MAIVNLMEERWYPIQVKQNDKTGRPGIDAFETAMRQSKHVKGFFVAFAYRSGAQNLFFGSETVRAWA